MGFTVTGLLIGLYVTITIWPRLLSLIFSGKRLFGSTLFTGRWLVIFIIMCVSALGVSVFAFINSADFSMLFQILTFMIVGTTLVSAYYATYIIYWMHGRDMKFNFALVGIMPAPFAIFSSALALLGSLITLNWFMLGFAIVYTASSIAFDLKGFFISRPSNT